MIGGQTKTPTMSVLYEKRADYVGGAGVVAKHLIAAGAKVTFRPCWATMRSGISF